MTDFQIALLTRDNQETAFSCNGEENLLAAAAKAGLNLPAGCREGNCGSCHGSCMKGELEMGSHSETALPSEENAILLCRTFPRSDLQIRIPAEMRHIAAPPAVWRQAEILAIDDLGGNCRRLQVQILPDDSGDIGPMFEAGQYMNLEVPGTGTSRAYSMSNAPNWDGLHEFLIRLQPGGICSSWLEQQAQPGQVVRLEGPQGVFQAKQGSLAPRHFVAGGTGLAPVLSMLRQMAEFGENNDSRLYAGVNRETELFGQDLLVAIDADLPNLVVEQCVWKPEGDWRGFTGSPADALQRDLATDMASGLAPEVYICGPPGLVDACQKVCKDVGLDESLVFFERFLPG